MACCPTDLNCDDVVNNQDIVLFIQLWNHRGTNQAPNNNAPAQPSNLRTRNTQSNAQPLQP